jgi:hypothetical protein
MGGRSKWQEAQLRAVANSPQETARGSGPGQGREPREGGLASLGPLATGETGAFLR